MEDKTSELSLIIMNDLRLTREQGMLKVCSNVVARFLRKSCNLDKISHSVNVGLTFTKGHWDQLQLPLAMSYSGCKPWPGQVGSVFWDSSYKKCSVCICWCEWWNLVCSIVHMWWVPECPSMTWNQCSLCKFQLSVQIITWCGITNIFYCQALYWNINKEFFVDV